MAACLLLAVTSGLRAQETGVLSYEEQVLGRGFGIETDVLQVGRLDQVNLFNGNLSVTIPLGQRYPVGGGLSYGFTLVYNSNAWDFRDTQCLNPARCICQEPEICTGQETRKTEAWPQLDANVGMGWRLSLGELYPPRRFGPDSEPIDKVQPNKSRNWSWHGPDGATHDFFPTLHNNVVDGLDPGDELWYTNDGSYLRMVVQDAGAFRRRLVQFPDGTEQVFEARKDEAWALPKHDVDLRVWQLVEIRNRFSANWVRIDPGVPVIDPVEQVFRWTETVSDSHGREHRLRFVQETVGVPLGSPVMPKRLETLDLAAFGGTRAVYQFAYREVAIARPVPHDHPDVPVAMIARVLDRLIQPDGSSYSGMTYTGTDGAPTDGHLQGRLATLTVPTGGRLEWDYGRTLLPQDQRCLQLDVHNNPIVFPSISAPPTQLTNAIGVLRRREVALDASTAEWSYARSFVGSFLDSAECLPLPIVPDMVTTVTDPLGNESEHFFSTFAQSNTLDAEVGEPPTGYIDDYPTTAGWRRLEYGLPFTRRFTEPANSANSPLAYLSSRHYSGSVATGTLFRSEYLSYEYGPPDVGNECLWKSGQCAGSNPRVVEKVTVFEDDGARTVVDSSSDFDGFGHYRSVDQASTRFFGGAEQSRSATTEYTPHGNDPGETYAPPSALWSFPYLIDEADVVDTSISLPGPAEPWLTEMFQEQVRRIGTSTVRSRFCFNESTGFLAKERRLTGASPGAHDVLVVRTAEAGTGNLAREELYGADAQALSLPDADRCGAAPSAAVHRTDHSYAHGVLTASQVIDDFDPTQPVVVETLDQTIDLNTGLPAKSRDAADVVTTLDYDALGRLTFSQVTGDAKLEVVYDPFQPSSPGDPARVTITRGPTAAPLTRAELELDGFGRVVREARELPGMTGANAVERLATYDALGRLATTTVPRASSATGTAKATRITRDAQGRVTEVTQPDGKMLRWGYTGIRRMGRTVEIDGTDSTTTAVFDAWGRVVRLDEPSGAAGALVRTLYEYDAGDRLARASTTVDSTTQVRRWIYDGLGFLRCESHPELAGVQGSCDAPDPERDGEPGTIRYEDYDPSGNAGRVHSAGVHSLERVFDAAGRLYQLWDDRTGDLLQENLYARSNSGSGASLDRRLGKLVQTKRHNRIGGQYTVISESFRYQGRAGRLSEATLRSTTGRRFVTGYTYDGLGNPTRIDYPSCASPDCAGTAPPLAATFGYDKGLLTRVSEQVDADTVIDWSNGITYHPTGLVSRVPHTGGVAEVIAADPNGMARPGGIAFGTLWDLGGFTWDGAGNVVRIGSGTSGNDYDYDAVGRLTRGEVRSGAAAQSASYDAFGNLTTLAPGRIVAGGIQPDRATNRLALPSDPAQAPTYDALGRLTGNLLSIAEVRWDAFDRPTRLVGLVGQRDYLYDPSGRRVATRDLATGDEQWTVRSSGDKVLREFNVTGGPAAPAASWRKDYFYRGSLLLGSDEPGPRRRHYYLDHLGSTRLVTNRTQNPDAEKARYEYYPFGQLAEATGPEASDHRLLFTGHERDFNSGEGVAENDDLDYMLARSYSPVMGRFLSMDEVQGEVGRPQSWNRYSYLRNRPLTFVDPDGRQLRPSSLQLVHEYEVALYRTQHPKAVRVGVDYPFSVPELPFARVGNAYLGFQFVSNGDANLIGGVQLGGTLTRGMGTDIPMSMEVTGDGTVRAQVEDGFFEYGDPLEPGLGVSLTRPGVEITDKAFTASIGMVDVHAVSPPVNIGTFEQIEEAIRSFLRDVTCPIWLCSDERGEARQVLRDLPE